MQAANLRLLAGLGIGALGDPLEISVALLAAAATTGGIRLRDEDDVTVGTVNAVSVNRVSVTATTASVGDAAATSDLVTTTGPVELTSVAGSITWAGPVGSAALASLSVCVAVMSARLAWQYTHVSLHRRVTTTI